MSESVDGGYVFTGNFNLGWNVPANAYMRKVNALGVQEWVRSYGNSNLITAGEKCIQVGNQYTIVSGQKNIWGASNSVQDILLMRTDSLGFIYSNVVKGNVFNDLNFNYGKETGKPNFKNVK